MKLLFAKKCFALLVLLTICGTASFAQRRRAQPATPPGQISGMKIIPYNRATDSFEDDIADSQDGHLNELDLSFLVKVEVSGTPGEFSNRMLTVTAREGNTLVLNKTMMVGIYGENGKSIVAAWIYAPLCSPTVVQATLSGTSRRKTIKKTMQFNCGE